MLDDIANAIGGLISGPGTYLTNYVMDAMAYALVGSTLNILGEYAHRRAKACALDDSCRQAADDILQGRTILAGDIALALSGNPGVAAVLTLGAAGWWAYKRAYASGEWTTLRGKVEYMETRYRKAHGQ
jgi:hypothetical protein